jgi:hypothetical protein
LIHHYKPQSQEAAHGTEASEFIGEEEVHGAGISWQITLTLFCE